MPGMSRTSPSLFQRLRYLAGQPLPPEMPDWVRADVTGPGHARRYLTRGLIPLIPILIAFYFVPGPLIYRLCMMALLLIPLIYFQIALIRIYRRHLLATNGLDPDMLNAKRDKKRKETKSEYESIYRRD